MMMGGEYIVRRTLMGNDIEVSLMMIGSNVDADMKI